MQINGRALLNTGGSGGAVHLSAPNGESGIGIVGTNRVDLRFDGSTLKLVAGSGTNPPAVANGIAIDTSANVTIGNGLTVHLLSIESALLCRTLFRILWSVNSFHIS